MKTLATSKPVQLRKVPLSSIVAAVCFTNGVMPLTAATFGNFTYFDNGTTITITAFDDAGNSSALIPSSINGKPVTTIGENAFYYSEIRSVTIPSTVTSIDAGAFYGCEFLNRISLPTSVTSIGDSAFSWSGLNSVTIPSSVTAIGNTAFSYCENLNSLTIPSNVAKIGNSAFSDCWSLSSVTIASRALLDGTFIGCHDLKSVTFFGDAPSVMNSPFSDTDTEFRIYYYDGNKGFTWPTWQGYPTSPIGAEITVQQPTGSFLIDSASKKTFGSVAVKTSKTKKFTIKNIGTANLTGFSITKSGTGKKSFSVTRPAKNILSPGSSTSFNVTFKPTSKGVRSAVIHIKSNDMNESSFDISLRGLGVK
jgi:hypothetical protein